MANVVSAILNNLGYFKVKQWNGRPFYVIGGNIGSDFWGEQPFASYIKDFIEIPELNAIINYRAWSESHVKLEVVSKQTGEPVKNNEPLVRILRNPNWFQSQQEFWRQTVIYRQATGNEYIYLLAPTGMGTNFKGMFTLPPHHVFVVCPEKYFFMQPQMPKSIKYYFKAEINGNELMDLDTKDLLHLTENKINYDFDKPSDLKDIRKNYMYGTSPLASLTNELKTLRLIHEGRYSLRDVPAGVFGSDSRDKVGNIALTDDEKKRLQEDISQYSMARSKFQWVISNKSLSMRSTVVDIEKLKLYDDNRKSVENICATMGVPIELVGGKETTYENKKQAEKQMYQDTIIPAAQERIQAINRKLGTDEKSWEVIGTYSHLPLFQENEQERANAVSTLVTALDKALTAGAITIEDYKKELQRFNIG